MDRQAQPDDHFIASADNNSHFVALITASEDQGIDVMPWIGATQKWLWNIYPLSSRIAQLPI